MHSSRSGEKPPEKSEPRDFEQRRRTFTRSPLCVVVLHDGGPSEPRYEEVTHTVRLEQKGEPDRSEAEEETRREKEGSERVLTHARTYACTHARTHETKRETLSGTGKGERFSDLDGVSSSSLRRSRKSRATTTTTTTAATTRTTTCTSTGTDTRCDDAERDETTRSGREEEEQIGAPGSRGP